MLSTISIIIMRKLLFPCRVFRAITTLCRDDILIVISKCPEILPNMSREVVTLPIKSVQGMQDAQSVDVTRNGVLDVILNYSVLLPHMSRRWMEPPQIKALSSIVYNMFHYVSTRGVQQPG